jgi:glycosyltransferase involved in cell wall biosynthesis
LLAQIKDTSEFIGEVIVVDNNSSDETSQIAKSKGVKVVFEPQNQISRARNLGAKNANGKNLIFLDADTKVSAELLKIVLNALNSNDSSGGGATLIFDSNQNLFLLGTFVPRLWSWISKTFKFAAGSFIFCRKEIFEQIGGFSEKLYAGEEILFSQRFKQECKKNGLKFLIIEDYPVVTSSRKLVWYTSLQILIFIFIPIIFPWSLRIRSLCTFWYHRPQK